MRRTEIKVGPTLLLSPAKHWHPSVLLVLVVVEVVHINTLGILDLELGSQLHTVASFSLHIYIFCGGSSIHRT